MNRGFTLTEVIISVGIIGVISGIVIANSGVFSQRTKAGYDLTQSASALTGMMEYACTSANSKRLRYAVGYDWDLNCPESCNNIPDSISGEHVRALTSCAVFREQNLNAGDWVLASNADGFVQIGEYSCVVLRHPDPDTGHYVLGKAYDKIVHPEDVGDDDIIDASEINQLGLGLITVASGQIDFFTPRFSICRLPAHIFTHLGRMEWRGGQQRCHMIVTPRPNLPEEIWLNHPAVESLIIGDDNENPALATRILSNIRGKRISVYKETARIKVIGL